jgi:hypothetical protein
METSSDSKKGAISGDGPQLHSLQPTISRASKGHPHNQTAAMATIADDDDRLLVRIGYTPVCPLCFQYPTRLRR